MYEERYPNPNLWFRLPNNTYTRPGVSQLVKNVQAAVVSFSTRMTLSDPGQCTWTATFVATPNGVSAADVLRGTLPSFAAARSAQTWWYNNIKAMDLVGISLGKSPVYFIGCVTNKQRSRSVVGGKVVNSITISGVALGGIFSRQNILALYNLGNEFRDAPGAWGILANSVFGERLTFLTETTGQQLRASLIMLFRKFLAIDIRFDQTPLSGSVPALIRDKLEDYLDLDSGVSQELAQYYTNRNTTVFPANSSVSLWQKAREFIPNPWFEAWFDVGLNPDVGDKVVLYARKPPFGYTRWNELPNASGNIVETVTLEEVVEESVGVDCSDVMSIFYPKFTGTLLSKDSMAILFPPLVSERLMQRFGIRAYQPEVTFVTYPSDEDNAGQIWGMMKGLRGALAEWYSLADEMESGTLTVKGRTDLRIGYKMRLRYSDSESKDFYIEGVDQSWSLRSPWVTKLSVTRGLSQERLFATIHELNLMESQLPGGMEQIA